MTEARGGGAGGRDVDLDALSVPSRDVEVVPSSLLRKATMLCREARDERDEARHWHSVETRQRQEAEAERDAARAELREAEARVVELETQLRRYTHPPRIDRGMLDMGLPGEDA